jgi:hypothetical protein
MTYKYYKHQKDHLVDWINIMAIAYEDSEAPRASCLRKCFISLSTSLYTGVHVATRQGGQEKNKVTGIVLLELVGWPTTTGG